MHRAQRLEIRQAIARLSTHAFFFARTADRPEVAPGARPIAGRGGEESRLDRAIDDLEHLQPLAARVVVDRNRLVHEAADGRRVIKTTLDDLLAERLLHGDAVEDGLQHRAAADDE